jgi:putative tricarboxylic transport membrane protein
MGDLVGGLFWSILGIALCAGGVKLNLGTLRIPGSGFFPFLIGIFMALFGIALIFPNLSKWAGKDQEEVTQKTPGVENWRRALCPILTLCILLGYLFFLEHLGFIITTFLFLFSLFKLSTPKKWFMPLVISMGTAVVGYFFFCKWLQCQFPLGILRHFLR